MNQEYIVMIKNILYQMSSCRWLLTLITGLSFGYLAVTNKIDPKDVMVIVTMVFLLYFQKDRTKEEPK